MSPNARAKRGSSSSVGDLSASGIAIVVAVIVLSLAAGVGIWVWRYKKLEKDKDQCRMLWPGRSLKMQRGLSQCMDRKITTFYRSVDAYN
jgi:hypothetical protein